MPRAPVHLAALGLVLSACVASPGTVTLSDAGAATAHPAPAVVAPPTPGAELHGLQETLDAVAEAFGAADPEALRPHLHDPADAFGQRWLERARSLADVPLSHYRLRHDPSLPDLSTAEVRAAHDRPVAVVYVVEEHAIEGFDADGPAYEDLFLTVVRHDDGWRVAADTDAEALGLVSVDHLWDHGPVTTTTAGPVLALHHPDSGDVDAVLAEARRALARVEERWPLAWSGAVPVIVPRSQDELAQLLHVTFDLSNFIAFATATSSGELGEYRLTGTRIVLNPDRFLERSSTTRELILIHELLHVATRPHAGPSMPSWLEEGIAQALGERRSTTGTRLLDAVLAGGRPELPTDGDFTTGGRDRIFLSYQLAWSFVDHLRRTHGAEAVARFYAAAGRGSVGEPGTGEWHIDRAAREVFGMPFEELVAGWR